MGYAADEDVSEGEAPAAAAQRHEADDDALVRNSHNSLPALRFCGQAGISQLP